MYLNLHYVFIYNLDKSSYHPYRSNNGKRRYSATSSSGSSAASNRVVTVEEALRTDRILSIESFANVERINDQEIASKEYAKYIKRHQKAHLRNLYNLHKKEKWIINLIKSSDAKSFEKSSFDSINWSPEINLEYKEGYEMKLEESPIEGNFISGTETRIHSNESSIIPMYFSQLLPEFSDQIITMTNVPPHADKEALEGHVMEFASDSEIEVTSPNPDKNFYRLAWLKLKNGSNEKVEELVSKLESLGSIEGAKIYFGIASSNFRRFKVTNYVEGSEDELLKIAIQIIKSFDKEFDESSFTSENSLDVAVIYLRKVHNFCFYCAMKFGCPHEISAKCGDLHLRHPSGSEQVKHDQHRLIEKLTALIDFIKELNEISVEGSDNFDDALAESSIKKVEEGKYRCNHCAKAFKGPEFVLKHLMLKHEDVVLQTQTELEDFKKLVSNAQLWLFPSTMIPRYTKIRNKNFHGSRDSQGSSKSSLNRNHQHRITKDYMDWDAAANNNASTEISYDL